MISLMRLLVAALMLLSAVSAEAVIYSSTFDGSQNPLSEGGTWAGLGTNARPQKVSGEAAAVNVNDVPHTVYVPGVAIGANQYSEVTLSVLGGGAVLGSIVPFTPAVGHVYRLECLNASPVQLNFYDNGSLLFSASDANAPLASGSVGFFLNGTTFKFTAWAGGDAVADMIPPTNPTNLTASATGSASFYFSDTATT